MKEGADQLGTEAVVAVKASVVPPNPWEMSLAALKAQLLPSDIRTESIAAIDNVLASIIIGRFISAADRALLQAWRNVIQQADPNGDLMQQVLANLQ